MIWFTINHLYGYHYNLDLLWYFMWLIGIEKLQAAIGGIWNNPCMNHSAIAPIANQTLQTMVGVWHLGACCQGEVSQLILIVRVMDNCIEF